MIGSESFGELSVMDMGDADFVAAPSDIAETRERLERKGAEFVEVVEELASALRAVVTRAQVR